MPKDLNNDLFDIAQGVSFKDGPNYDLERKIALLTCGVDEVGRGPWAGPVMAAAVILDPDNIPEGLNDSKKLSKKKREALYPLIMQSSIVGVGESSVQEIDEINILQASLLAMRRAIENLSHVPEYALIDGNKIPERLPCPASFLIKGDAKSLSISAASIIAKINRDKFMANLALKYPEYGWESNSGYGVAHHRKALSLVGITPFHRKSFKPIHDLMTQDSPSTS